MSTPRTPPLYSTGRWQLKAPFSAQINSGATYVCKAIRSFDDLKALGYDPFTRYYQPAGIDAETYNEDALALANIITLMSDTHPTVYVPDTYILSYPDTTLIPYRHMVLSISLGALPDTLALDDLKEKMQELVLESLGVESAVKFFQAPGVAESVDVLTHQATENNRKARIANNTSLSGRMYKLQRENENLRRDKGVLIKICQDNGLM